MSTSEGQVDDVANVGIFNRVMQALARPLVALTQRYMPDAFIFAILLSALTFVLAIVLAEASPVEAVDAWGNGFWKLQTFAAQMAMILITGLVLAQTPVVRRGILAIVELATTPARAYALAYLVPAFAGLFSWGMCLIVGGVVARETANSCLRRGITVHYPLLVAAAYSGMITWHQGLSGSVPLKIAETNHFLIDKMGVVPFSETVFSYMSLVIVFTLLITVPFLLLLMGPPKGECVAIAKELKVEEPASTQDDQEKTPATILNNTRAFNFVIVAGILAYLWLHFIERNGGINTNIINLIFLSLGLILTRSPVHYMELALAEGRGIAAIILQFPFYAGIMGIMTGTGLATFLAAWFVSFSTAETLPFWSMISGGLINLFVPSGGGQWAVQGPIMMEAAQTLGADLPRVAMGVAIGDQWTNMLQPFWAIPVLAIAGLGVRDIMGYTAVVFLWSGLVFSFGLLYL
ncbi:MAG: short-chain fatty acid transporter [Hyphomicrobiaceae bacterium]